MKIKLTIECEVDNVPALDNLLREWMKEYEARTRGDDWYTGVFRRPSYLLGFPPCVMVGLTTRGEWKDVSAVRRIEVTRKSEGDYEVRMSNTGEEGLWFVLPHEEKVVRDEGPLSLSVRECPALPPGTAVMHGENGSKVGIVNIGEGEK